MAPKEPRAVRVREADGAMVRGAEGTGDDLSQGTCVAMVGATVDKSPGAPVGSQPLAFFAAVTVSSSFLLIFFICSSNFFSSFTTAEEFPVCFAKKRMNVLPNKP